MSNDDEALDSGILDETAARALRELSATDDGVPREVLDRVRARSRATLEALRAGPTPAAEPRMRAYQQLMRPWIFGPLSFVAGLFIASEISIPTRGPPPPLPQRVELPTSGREDESKAVVDAGGAGADFLLPAPQVDAGSTTRPAKPHRNRPTAAATSLADQSTAERRLIETAQSALARGRVEMALEALQRHASHFPSGAFSEERDGLWIHALATAGRGRDARARAAAFRSLYPGSMLQPGIDAALELIP